MWLTSARTSHDAHGVAASSWSGFTLASTERVDANACSSASVVMRAAYAANFAAAMEKLVYLVWDRPGRDAHELGRAFLDGLVPRLLALDPRGLELLVD